MSEPVKTTANGVRTTTVLWGATLVIAAGVAFASTLIDFHLDPAALTPQVVILLVVGLGALLVFAAVVGAVLRSLRRR